MTAEQFARAYLDAWNARDAGAIVAAFADGGTYEDPTTGGPIAGTAIGDNATMLWHAFPDLSFDAVHLAQTGPNRAIAEWRMTGTNSGSFRELPPTGRRVDVPGVDLFTVGPAGILSVRGYFDSRAVPDQLGLQVVIQPHAVGPFHFGTSAAVQSGKRTRPGAFSITQITNVSEAEIVRTRTFSRAVMTEMAKLPGFIGVMTARLGDRGITLSAWERPEDPAQLLRSPAHVEAMRLFFAEFGGSAYTSVWIADRINPVWIACHGCRKVVDYEKSGGVCGCGAPLPETPPYL